MFFSVVGVLKREVVFFGGIGALFGHSGAFAFSQVGSQGAW